MKHKIVLYKKPRTQRIKEAIEEEIKHERESLGMTGKWSLNQISQAKIDDSRSAKNLVQSFWEREEKSLHNFDE